MADYNRIAPYYSFLSVLVFGNSQIKAQQEVFRQISGNDKVLLVGGGTGQCLESLPPTFQGTIDFVEKSPKMQAIAQKHSKNLSINWFCQDIFTFQSQTQYDHQILPFFLDNFSTAQVTTLINKLTQNLKPTGAITLIDFTEDPKGWQKLLLRLMYFFFRIVADVKVKSMPAVEKIMTAKGFVIISKKSHYFRFIETTRYQFPI